jgi:hypothetical protein
MTDGEAMEQFRRGQLVFDVRDSGLADGPVVVRLHGHLQSKFRLGRSSGVNRMVAVSAHRISDREYWADVGVNARFLRA